MKLTPYQYKGHDNSDAADATMMKTSSELVFSRYGLSGELHPLHNAVVMTNLIKYLPLRDLATCRAICKTWHDLTLSAWRSSVTLRIGYLDNSDCGGPYLGNDPHEDGTSFRSLLDCWDRDYVFKPFRKARVERWTLGDNGHEVEDHVDMTSFWELVGTHLEKLKLRSCRSTVANDLFKILIEHCPLLKSLSLSQFHVSASMDKYINGRLGYGALAKWRDRKQPRGEHHLNSLSIYYSMGSITDNLAITYLELLSTFPHLKIIKLHSTNPDQECVDILRAVRDLRVRKEHACLALQVGTGFPVGFPTVHSPNTRRWQEILELIGELRVTLQSICLAHMSCSKSIKEVVELNGPTLITLVASMIHPLEQRCKFPFGMQLDNLQLLAMSEDFCESFEFIKYTPNLKKLIIDDARESHTGEVLPGRPPRITSLIANSPMAELANVRLHKLVSFKMQSMVSEDGLECLIKWFPNVKELEMYLDDSQFAMVCQNWQQLVKLVVYGDGLTDEGVTGLKFPKGTPQSKKFPLASQPRIGNITCLKSLTEFSFTGARLTELSVFHGFLKHESLRKISFGNQFRKSMLSNSRSALHRNHVTTVGYSSHEAKYHLYDLRTALFDGSALLYWKAIKLP